MRRIVAIASAMLLIATQVCYATIQFVNVSSAVGATVTIPTSPAPAASDIMVIITTGGASTATPSGWTLIDSKTQTGVVAQDFWKAATGSDTGFTFADNTTRSWVLCDYSGVNNSTPIDKHSTNSGNNTLPLTATLTPTANGDQFLGLYGLAQVLTYGSVLAKRGIVGWVTGVNFGSLCTDVPLVGTDPTGQAGPGTLVSQNWDALAVALLAATPTATPTQTPTATSTPTATATPTAAPTPTPTAACEPQVNSGP